MRQRRVNDQTGKREELPSRAQEPACPERSRPVRTAGSRRGRSATPPGYLVVAEIVDILGARWQGEGSMASYFRRITCPTLSLAIYVVCLALVVSFILFEVLDIDGSDFPGRASASTTAVRLAEPPHDIKRAHLRGLGDGWTYSCPLVACGQDHAVGFPRIVAPSPPPSPAHIHAYRPTLARASIPHRLPSA